MIKNEIKMEDRVLAQMLEEDTKKILSLLEKDVDIHSAVSLVTYE